MSFVNANMSPKAQASRSGKMPYFQGPSMDPGGPSPVTEDPGFTWQHRALNRPKMHDMSDKRLAETSDRNKPLLSNFTMLSQVGSRDISDEQAILLNTIHPKDNSRGNKTTNDSNRTNGHARPSSVSTCGDLEGPYRVTPHKSRLSVDDEPSGISRHPEHIFDNAGYDGGCNSRSRSRTSNISRKRSSVNKHRPKPDPGRKKMLMHQVTQYWNECISIAEEEKAQAKLEIDQLRDELRQQHTKLQEAQQLLETERTERQDMDKTLKEVEEKNVEAMLENSTMCEESTALKEQLRSSKERAAVLTEKSKTYRTKLNEAILEQQRLFLQAKEFYHESIQKLRQENENRVAETKVIETALANSREKREKMRHCLDELRSGVERDIIAKDALLSQLRERISVQEEALIAEKQISSDLRSQVSSMASLQRNEVQALVNTIESLRESISTTAMGQPDHLQLSNSVCGRLQDLEESVKSLAKHPAQETDTVSIIQSLHELVSTDLFSAVVRIGDTQSCTYDTLVGIRNDCHAELSVVRSALSDLSQQQSEMQEQNAVKGQDFISRLNAVQGTVDKTQQLCDKNGRNMSAWFTEERNTMNEERSSWNNMVVQQLIDRNERIENLKRTVHEARRSYLSKFDAFSETVAIRDDKTRLLMQQMVDEFQCVMDQTLHQEKAKAEFDVKETQRVLTNLEHQIGKMSEQLERVEAKTPNQIDSNEHKRQHEEALCLREKIQQLEKEASETTSLQNRWHSDIQMVDKIRSEMKQLQHLSPQVSECTQRVAKLSNITKVLDSTSEYLVEQEKWVKQQLCPCPTQVNPNMVTPPRTAVQQHTSQPIEVCSSESTIDANLQLGVDLESGKMGSTQYSRPEHVVKRVQVHSPAEVHSLSSPPSVEQEQKLRRIMVAMRPILKANSLSSSQESTTVEQQYNETETELGPVQEARRTVASTRSTSAASQKIIDEISSGFITDRSDNEFFSLPRVTDYQPSLKALPCQNVRQKRQLEEDDREPPKTKRIKLLGVPGMEASGRRSSENKQGKGAQKVTEPGQHKYAYRAATQI